MNTSTHDIDLLVGTVLRQIRLSQGFTLQSLAERSGVTYQQIQKYETGANRLSVSRLFLLTNSLGVTAAHFLQQVQDQMEIDSHPEKHPERAEQRFVNTETGRKVIASLAAIEDDAVLKSIANLLATIRNSPKH